MWTDPKIFELVHLVILFLYGMWAMCWIGGWSLYNLKIWRKFKAGYWLQYDDSSYMSCGNLWMQIDKEEWWELWDRPHIRVRVLEYYGDVITKSKRVR